MDQHRQLDLAELVEGVRSGDPAAWEALTGRYTNLLWFIARGMRLNSEDAADAIQTTWLRLVERIDSVRQPAGIGGWLATTMRHECLAVLRRRARLVVSETWDDLPDDADPLDDGLLRDEQDSALWRAFRSLNSRCQLLLRVLMADPTPSYAEVAAALDMPVGSIGPTRQRCLTALRGIMSSGAYPFDPRSSGSR
jgi:RNA polymerase sigma factor (sigma-70 family)